MSDWYDEGKQRLIDDIVVNTGLSEEDVRKVYIFLGDIGLIDYDIEKDIIYDDYQDD